MNFLQIMQLIIQLWPIIEKILEAIEDENEKKNAQAAAKEAVARMIMEA